jgi:demethylspheroidene O-methyltransferase
MDPVAALGGPVLAPASAPTWRERWLAWRNKRLADPGFQRAAAKFWLTRGIARRRARELFDLCAGFVYSQVLYACVRGGVLEALRDGPLSAADVGARVDLPAEAARTLLDAAATLKLVGARRDGRYELDVHGATVLGAPAVIAMIEHHAVLYADLADPLALLRGERRPTALQQYWAYAATDAPRRLEPGAVAAYTELMSRSQPLVAHDVLDVYSLRAHRRVLDVGGGDGTFLCALAARAPHVHVTLFDLPPVAAKARERFLAAGLAARAEAVGGDFRADPLPAGADLVTFVRVLHDHDDATVLTLLRAARRALAPGGRLLIAEPMAGAPGAEPMGGAYFGLYLFAMGQGRPRTPAELSELARQAGFAALRSVPTPQPLQTQVLVSSPGDMNVD